MSASSLPPFVLLAAPQNPQLVVTRAAPHGRG